MSISYIVLGLLSGVLSGIVGLGGGVFIVPSLVYLFHFSQKTAQGTTLALLVPPIGILAAWTYYRQGNVDIKAAALICLGFFVGALFGGKIAVMLPNLVLKKIFAVFLLTVGVKMLIEK